MTYAPRVISNTAALASSHATVLHASARKASSSATHLIRTMLDCSARDTAKARARAITFLTLFGLSSHSAKTIPAKAMPSQDAAGTPCAFAPQIHLITLTPTDALPGAGVIETPYGQRCNTQFFISDKHFTVSATGQDQITGALPRVGVGRALHGPPESSAAAPHNAKRAVARPPRLLVSDPSNFAPRRSRQGLTKQNLCATPIARPSNNRLLAKIYHDKLAHVVVSMPAPSSVRPVSVQQS